MLTLNNPVVMGTGQRDQPPGVRITEAIYAHTNPVQHARLADLMGELLSV